MNNSPAREFNLSESPYRGRFSFLKGMWSEIWRNSLVSAACIVHCIYISAFLFSFELHEVFHPGIKIASWVYVPSVLRTS